MRNALFTGFFLLGAGACSQALAPSSSHDASDASSAACEDGGPLGVFGGPCTTSSDCGGGGDAFCVFAESDGCGAAGRCYTDCTGNGAGANEVFGCACDGSEMTFIPLVLPGGYALQPLRSVPKGQRCSSDAGAATDGGS
jgi:hypothetical protein